MEVLRVVMSKTLVSLQHEIAELIVDCLSLEDVSASDIDVQAPLFAGGLELDSIDALEIGAALSKRYSINLKSQSEDTERHFNSIESLANFVMQASQDEIPNSVS